MQSKDSVSDCNDDIIRHDMLCKSTGQGERCIEYHAGLAGSPAAYLPGTALHSSIEKGYDLVWVI
jgi:hypothetical protein